MTLEAMKMEHVHMAGSPARFRRSTSRKASSDHGRIVVEIEASSPPA
jgi:hypothetical protein